MLKIIIAIIFCFGIILFGNIVIRDNCLKHNGTVIMTNGSMGCIYNNGK